MAVLAGEVIPPSLLHWMYVHMYRGGMAILADKMHTNVRLYTNSTRVCLHYLSVALEFATPLPG